MQNKMFKTTITLAIIALLSAFSLVNSNTTFYKKLNKYCSTLPSEFNQISDERKKDLKEIGDYIIEKKTANKRTNLLFICTSNSRRSHMGQIWATTASIYYGIDSLFTFSGGTEATKVNINAVSALRRCGFSVTNSQSGDNPMWFVAMGNEIAGFAIFSKKFSHSINPKKDFCAIMVCSEADKSCPSVDGADLRIALPYEDPKYYDNTPSQDQKYDERCRQIATETFFMMSYVKEKWILKSESKK